MEPFFAGGGDLCVRLFSGDGLFCLPTPVGDVWIEKEDVRDSLRFRSFPHLSHSHRLSHPHKLSHSHRLSHSPICWTLLLHTPTICRTRPFWDSDDFTLPPSRDSQVHDAERRDFVFAADGPWDLQFFLHGECVRKGISKPAYFDRLGSNADF